MGTYVGRVGGNINGITDGIFTAPYALQDQQAGAYPRVKAYTGWASYKNVKSGQYNRQLCGECLSYKGFPQDAGVYNLNISNTPPPPPNYAAMQRVNEFYQIYQADRMNNQPLGNALSANGLPAGAYGSKYVNYLNAQSGSLYPQQYVKGYWPDEQLEFTSTPTGNCN
jgi:hypothetical protein